MWTCPQCQTEVETGFDVCWNCGTSVEGVADPSFRTADALGPVDPSPASQVTSSHTPPHGELVEAYRALDLQQAQFLADQLSNEGIAAVADTYDLHEAIGSMSDRPRVWVGAGDLAAARAWLTRFEAQQSHPVDPADDR